MLIKEQEQYQVNDFFIITKGSGIPNLFTNNISLLFHSINLSEIIINILGKRNIIFEFLKLLINFKNIKFII